MIRTDQKRHEGGALKEASRVNMTLTYQYASQTEVFPKIRGATSLDAMLIQPNYNRSKEDEVIVRQTLTLKPNFTPFFRLHCCRYSKIHFTS